MLEPSELVIISVILRFIKFIFLTRVLTTWKEDNMKLPFFDYAKTSSNIIINSSINWSTRNSTMPSLTDGKVDSIYLRSL